MIFYNIHQIYLAVLLIEVGTGTELNLLQGRYYCFVMKNLFHLFPQFYGRPLWYLCIVLFDFRSNDVLEAVWWVASRGLPERVLPFF
jgi:hypothetical protein